MVGSFVFGGEAIAITILGMTTPMQATPYVHLTMNCQNPSCGKPIQLPPPTILDASSNRAEWPKGDWLRRFVCAECGQGYEYSSTDIRQAIEATENPWALGQRRCFELQYVCAFGNCCTPIAAYVVGDADLAETALLGRLGPSFVPQFSCTNTKFWVNPDRAIRPDPQQALNLSACQFPY